MRISRDAVAKRAKKFKISIQLSIVSIFVLILIAVSSTIFSFTYFRLHTSIFTASQILFDQTTKLVKSEIIDYFKPLSFEGKFISEVIEKKVIDPNDQHAFMIYLSQLLHAEPDLSAGYWGDIKGNFIYASRLNDGNLRLEVLTRPNGKTEQYIEITDPTGKVLKQENNVGVTYDPRLRPWYQKAERFRGTIWTDLYWFTRDKVLGITSASPVYDSVGRLVGVVGLDIKLDEVSKFLSDLKISDNGVVFIVDQSGELSAAPYLAEVELKEASTKTLPRIEDMDIPWITESFRLFQKSGKDSDIFNFHYKGMGYIASYYKLEFEFITDNDWFIAIVVPENDILGELKRANLAVLVICIITLILGSIIVRYFAKKISNPIIKLTRETQRIKNFQLDEDTEINTRVKELVLMRDAVFSMKTGLRSFQRYVPASLVRRLISRGEEATVGGKEKEITLFFMDVANFTHIAESLAPEELMIKLSEYFEEMTKIIMKDNGTVDKYIGDAIMAFWGAPDIDEKQAYHSCLAAVRIGEFLEVMRDKPGTLAISVRIGINSGEAIVGNVGSSDRLAYSALGDSVNLASRLESLNKFYKTDTIVSESTYEQVADAFNFRFLDKVAVKGKTKGVRIYELISEVGDQPDPSIKAYNEKFIEAFGYYENMQWDEALTKFKQLHQAFPEVYAVELFISRCEELKLNPPTAWDGVWIYHEK